VRVVFDKNPADTFDIKLKPFNICLVVLSKSHHCALTDHAVSSFDIKITHFTYLKNIDRFVKLIIVNEMKEACLFSNNDEATDVVASLL